jgi:O-antigen/teichoic acid export membrane protein
VGVFACWSVTALVATGLGAIQLRRWFGYRYRPGLCAADIRGMLRMGLPNQLLTMTERAPQLLLPALLAHVVAPEATAYWYPAWMMAWIIYTAPVSVGLVQFAEAVREPAGVWRTVWTGLRWSLVLGGGLAIVLAVAAEPLLGLMGSEYATASATAVRVLAVGLVPFAVLQAYNAVCRARQQLAEGITFGVVLGALSVGCSLAVAAEGPTAIAVAWVASLSCGAIWALVRLRTLAARRPPAPTGTSGEAVDG